eukprot:TRINITY_DN6048_c0_g1_i1.p1 TRINITY_DN6048_c0_g1~~TRINITY_DN6048_c0_g1_i1.p1  ORF type:complete len:372 (-),score=65.53 TRINITY_DN6048_c0_g1_i1:125-1240(-)
MPREIAVDSDADSDGTDGTRYSGYSTDGSKSGKSASGYCFSIAGCLSFLAASGLTWVAAKGLSNDAVITVDQVLQMDESSVVTTKDISMALLVLGCLGMVAAAVAVLSVSFRRPRLVKASSTALVVLSIIVLILGFWIIARRHFVEPQVSEQVTHMCHPVTYYYYGQQLSCAWAYNASAGAGDKDCGPAGCEAQVDKLKEIDGCDLLARLCNDQWSFAKMSPEARDKAMTNGRWEFLKVEENPLEEPACRDVCSGDIACDAYIYSSTDAKDNTLCILMMQALPSPTQTRLQKVPYASIPGTIDNAPGTLASYQKSAPAVIDEFRSESLWLAASTLFLGVLLAVAVPNMCMYGKRGKRDIDSDGPSHGNTSD